MGQYSRVRLAEHRVAAQLFQMGEYSLLLFGKFHAFGECSFRHTLNSQCGLWQAQVLVPFDTHAIHLITTNETNE